ncbi:MAG: DUF805 domain-containing protein [Caulobacteraceae bacterium]
MDYPSLLFSFSGRIRRMHYWLASIAVAIVYVVLLSIVFAIFGNRSVIGDLIVLVLVVATMWADLALQAKRWHDRNKSAAWLLITLIPVLGWLWVLIECGFLDGTPGPNRFGPSPKGLGGPQPAAVAAT